MVWYENPKPRAKVTSPLQGLTRNQSQYFYKKNAAFDPLQASHQLWALPESHSVGQAGISAGLSPTTAAARVVLRFHSCFTNFQRQDLKQTSLLPQCEMNNGAEEQNEEQTRDVQQYQDRGRSGRAPVAQAAPFLLHESCRCLLVPLLPPPPMLSGRRTSCGSEAAL